MICNIKTSTITDMPGRKFFLPSALLWILFACSAAQSSTLVSTYITFPGFDNGKVVIDGNSLPLHHYGQGVYSSPLADTSMLTVSAEPEESIETREIPLPAAVWLFGSALVGFVVLSNKRSV